MNKYLIILTSILLIFSVTKGLSETDPFANEPKEKNREKREKSKVFIKPITFRFLDENDKPLNGDFTLHQTKNGDFSNNWYRYLPLNERGEVKIKSFPPEFEFGGSSKNEFYIYWFKSSSLNPTKDYYTFRCKPSGAMKFKIDSFPRKFFDSLVVEYHMKRKDGSYKLVKGIGIFPNDPEHTIGGLKEGQYFIKIKFNYKDKKEFFKSDQFTISVKKYTILPKINVTEAMIKKAGINSPKGF